MGAGSSLGELVAVAEAGWHGDIQTVLALTVGSAIQVALFVAPTLVFIARFLGVRDMNLIYNPFVLAILFLIVFSFQVHLFERRTNWFKGMQLWGSSPSWLQLLVWQADAIYRREARARCALYTTILRASQMLH